VLRPIENAASEVGVLKGLKLILTRQYRLQTFLALFILSFIQLSGIDGVLYVRYTNSRNVDLVAFTNTTSQYAPTVFAQAGLPSQTASFLASGVSAILMLVFSIPATLFADKWGRRTSAISGGVILSGSMLLVGSLYAADAVHSHGAARWVVIVLVFVFAIGYVSTWAVCGKIYASEIQPTTTRAITNSMATGGSFVSTLSLLVTTSLCVTLENSALTHSTNRSRIGLLLSQLQSSWRGLLMARISSLALSHR
jgi:MFS family permease